MDGTDERTSSQLCIDIEIGAGERQAVPPEFNGTDRPYPHNRAIHELFEQQAQKTPHAVAVAGESGALTYAELDASTNQLAHYMRERGVRAGDYVPVVMSRSLQMLIAQLAVLKCGGAYVPIDPSTPPERLTFIIRDCGARQLISDRSIAGNLDPAVAHIDSVHSASAISRCPNARLGFHVDAMSPAYVMYTSGSTGVPKGVVVPHRAVSRLVLNNEYIHIRPTDCIAHSSNPAFDASTFEIWGAFLNGARVLVVPQPVVLDPERFARTLMQHGATVVWLTTALFNQRSFTSPETFRGRRYVLFGGEAADPNAVRHVLRTCPPQCLLNMYGPTETTTFATWFPVSAVPDDATTLPIGRPISNTRIYILDAQLKPVPVGEIGQIYIGGPGVSLGYLNRPELTAERFIANPFSAEKGDRLYSSGDLARWRRDGTIDFIGRNDQQVKIRGFRIELGEIEAQLVRHPGVRQAAVLAHEISSDDKRLVAYVTEHERGTLTVEGLRAHLKRVLPEYTVPSAFVTLQTLPLTLNGKVDRGALPLPDAEAYGSQPYEAPEGEVEQAVARIWEELLRVRPIGRQANFFELGGNSLLIVHAADRLRRAGLCGEVSRMFESRTLAEWAEILVPGAAEHASVAPNLIPPDTDIITPTMLPLVDLTSEEIESIVRVVPGGAANVKDVYPLAPLQEGLLFHHLLNAGRGDTYVLLTLLSVATREKLEQLIAALESTIERHDILRTAILWERLHRPVQVVYRRATLPVEKVELRDDREALEQVREWMRPDRQELDLRRAPLLRLQVAAHPHDGSWYALLKLHHLVCDNESREILLEEVLAHVNARAQRLPEPVPYRNHVAQLLAHASRLDAEAFFRAKLGSVDEPTAPFGLSDVRGDGSHIDGVTRALEPALAARVRTQASRLRVTPAILFHSAWALVVARTSGREDIVFGTVLLGRLQGTAGAQRILGMFINTLPLRLCLSDLTAKELVRQTHRELVDLLAYEQVSLAVAQRSSGIGGSAPLFSALMNYRHSSPSPDTQLGRAPGIAVLATQNLTNYPLLLSVDDHGDAFTLTLDADRRIDKDRVMEYACTALESLVNALEREPHLPALALPVMPQQEHRQVIELCNPRVHVESNGKLVHERFEEQVARRPDAVAVVYERDSLTYAELNSRANQLAYHMVECGVRADQLVGVCLERGLDLVVALLAVSKAGGAYVPLDPVHPNERLAYMLKDAAPKILLTQRRLVEKLPPGLARLIVLDEASSEIACQPATNLDAAALGVSLRHLAYVIYTSGSTGQPKGVMVEHGNVARLFEATDPWFRFGEQDVWTLFHSFAFDFSVWEMWGALAYGGRLVVVPYLTARSPQDFYRLLCSEKVTVLNQTPSAFLQLIEAQGKNPQERHSLRFVIFGGEALELHTLRPWVARNGDLAPRLVNMYGITETTVHVSYRPLTRQEIESERSSPIGEPIPDLRIYLLDRFRQPLPMGIVGEMYVGGAGVARGYLRRPELTAERFIADPFSASSVERLYKTGDLGRRRPDGTIDYIGRNDQQVKIRGFRLELGEIEAQLARHPHVRDAVVIAREDAPGEKRLIAYVTARQGTRPSAEQLRAHLKSVLPDYMLPSAFVVLDTLPLTQNGKLDRGALPVPEVQSFASRKYEPPGGDMEQALARIWQKLLRVERVGRHDNFFDLGGHSLLATRMIAHVSHELDVDVPLSVVFEKPTLEWLATYITQEIAAELSMEAP